MQKRILSEEVYRQSYGRFCGMTLLYFSSLTLEKSSFQFFQFCHTNFRKMKKYFLDLVENGQTLIAHNFLIRWDTQILIIEALFFNRSVCTWPPPLVDQINFSTPPLVEGADQNFSQIWEGYIPIFIDKKYVKTVFYGSLRFSEHFSKKHGAFYVKKFRNPIVK